MLEVSADVQVVSAGASQSDGRLRGQLGKDGRDRTMDASVGRGPPLDELWLRPCLVATAVNQAVMATTESG